MLYGKLCFSHGIIAKQLDVDQLGACQLKDIVDRKHVNMLT